MESMNEALSLMIVGMVMVFSILFLVVIIGNIVIRITNRYIPEVQKASEGESTIKGVNSKKMAVLAAVIDHITQGEGRLNSVQKK